MTLFALQFALRPPVRVTFRQQRHGNARFVGVGALGACPPKAEAGDSNSSGCTNFLNSLGPAKRASCAVLFALPFALRREVADSFGLRSRSIPDPDILAEIERLAA